MKVRTLLGALALTAAAAAFVPTTAEAGHRHSRHCRQRYGYYSHSYRSYPSHSYYYRSYDRPYRSRSYHYDSYNYDSYYDDSYYYAPRPPRTYYYSRRCYRPRVGVYLGW